jgi:hypothetical protein
MKYNGLLTKQSKINIREMVLRWKRRDVILLFSSCFACREEARMMGSVYDVANYMTHELLILELKLKINDMNYK